MNMYIYLFISVRVYEIVKESQVQQNLSLKGAFVAVIAFNRRIVGVATLVLHSKPRATALLCCLLSPLFLPISQIFLCLTHELGQKGLFLFYLFAVLNAVCAYVCNYINHIFHIVVAHAYYAFCCCIRCTPRLNDRKI